MQGSEDQVLTDFGNAVLQASRVLSRKFADDGYDEDMSYAQGMVQLTLRMMQLALLHPEYSKAMLTRFGVWPPSDNHVSTQQRFVDEHPPHTGGQS